ncbi:MAG: Hpt domain-containing protein [Cyanobacteria bacterium J06636_16]
MALNPDIRDQAYQFFIEEAPELLQSLETELLTLSQDHSTTRIHTLMRTAHSIKGGAASVGLEAIATLSHRLENIFKALYSDVLQIDTDLESQLLQAYDCLRLPLAQQIETGQFDIEQAMMAADPIFDQIESRLGDALTETENYIPSSSDLGVDMVSSILEVDVAQGLERLTEVVENPDGYEVAGELRAQAEVFAGFAELLNLPDFGAIAEVTQRALDLHPDQALAIAQLALKDFEHVRQRVLNDKQAATNAANAADVMSPSAALVALATAGESDLLAQIVELPEAAAISAPTKQTTSQEAELAQPEATADLMDALVLEEEPEPEMDISLSQLADVFGSDLDLSIFEEVAASEPEESAADESVADAPGPDESVLDGSELDEWGLDEWKTPEPWPDESAINNEVSSSDLDVSVPAASDATADIALGSDSERLSLELLGSNLADLDLPDSDLADAERPTAERTSLNEDLNDDGDEMPLDLELEQSGSAATEEMSAAFDFSAFDLSELDLSAFDLEEPSLEEEPSSNAASEQAAVGNHQYAHEPSANASEESHLTDPDRIEWAPPEEDIGESAAIAEPLPAEVVEAVEDAYVHPRIDGEDYIVSFSHEEDSSEVMEATADEPAIAAEADEPDSGSIIHIRSDYVVADNASSGPASEPLEEMVQSVEQMFEELPVLENTTELAWQSPAAAPLPIMPDSPSDLVTVAPQEPTPTSPQSASRPPLSSMPTGKVPVAPGLTVRVEAERLEKMSNLVGELAINRDGTSLYNDQLQSTLKELLGQFSRFQERIQQLRTVSDQMLIAPERRRQSEQPQQSVSETLSNPWSTEFDSLEMDSYGALHLQLQEIFEDVIQLEERVGDVTLFAKQSDQKLSHQRQMLVQLRDDLTWARMVPLSEILNRFPRMIRDLSINYQKPASLRLTGASILVEKAILEKLYDPLLHLLRNAFDHGIEPSEARLRKGKPEEGEIEVRAYHRGNQTIIEIIDDGRGLDLDRISDRAIERG